MSYQQSGMLNKRTATKQRAPGKAGPRGDLAHQGVNHSIMDLSYEVREQASPQSKKCGGAGDRNPGLPQE